MVYSTDDSKWRAYQFSDPFAAGSFVVCNKINTQFCRPDCDALPITELRSEIKFVPSASDATKLGYSPCKSCNPTVVPSINVSLLLKTVKEINASIGFVPPLLDDDEDKVYAAIKENIIGHSHDQRRMSLPSNAYSKSPKNVAYAVSKNDSEHYRLIDLACRHLALAAANSILSAPSSASSPSSGAASPKEEAAQKKKGGRKRRGGVLGFKELATKSKLSAWHFHRVFKSIIGLTPKTYGDMCWEYLEKERDSVKSPLLKPADSAGSECDAGLGSLAQPYSIDGVKEAGVNLLDKADPRLSEQRLSDQNSSDQNSSADKNSSPKQKANSKSSNLSKNGGRKRGADQFNDSLQAPEPKRSNTGAFSFPPDMSEDKEFDLGSRATSEPNLAAIYGSAGPRSLFQHMPNFASYSQDPNPASHNSPEVMNDANTPEFNSDYQQPQYPVAQVAPQMTMNQTDFQLPSFGFDEDFSSVNISPMTINNDTSPLDMEKFGLSLDDPISLYFTPQADLGPLDHYMAPDNVPEMAVYDDKKAFDLATDPMMAGINDMLVASGY